MDGTILYLLIAMAMLGAAGKVIIYPLDSDSSECVSVLSSVGFPKRIQVTANMKSKNVKSARDILNKTLISGTLPHSQIFWFLKWVGNLNTGIFLLFCNLLTISEFSRDRFNK